MSQGAWKLEPSVTGVCKPGCMYYGMPDAPQHRDWQQQAPPAAALPAGRFWRWAFRFMGGPQPAPATPDRDPL